jgi:hypothetical protein
VSALHFRVFKQKSEGIAHGDFGMVQGAWGMALSI